MRDEEMRSRPAGRLRRWRVTCGVCGYEEVYENTKEWVWGRVKERTWCKGGHQVREGLDKVMKVEEEGGHVKLRVHVSPGNRKMGMVPSVSLVPGLSCEEGAPCLKEGCYALNMMLFRKSVEVSWMRNWLRWVTDKGGYFEDVINWIMRHKVEYFRWHVGGDIPNREYLAKMIMVANVFPDVRFVCFTKRYWMFPMVLPRNLTVVLSHWPGVKLPWYAGMEVEGQYWPVGWIRAKEEETKIPVSALECPHGCDECGKCWELKGLRRDVVFPWKQGYRRGK